MARIQSIAVVGGGPAGLYFALLAKRRRPSCSVKVFERNPRGATYGFGIVLADRGLRHLAEADRGSYRRIEAATYVTRHQLLRHDGQDVFIEGTGHGRAIARLDLLRILEECCLDAGVVLHHLTSVEGAPEADIVVAADGAHSQLRAGQGASFGTSACDLSGRMAWFGIERNVGYPHLVFRRAMGGAFVLVTYPFSDRRSTVVVECDEAAWESGLGRMSEVERQRAAETIFAPELGGERLLTNNSAWRSPKVVRNEQWWHGNVVLVGDALHSAHPSIGSGTRIAMEDAIALAASLDERFDDGPQAVFAAYRQRRESEKLKLIDAMDRSVRWFADFPRRMDESGPEDLAFDYLARTGRISDARLEREFPSFVARYGTFSARRTGQSVESPA